VPQHLDFSIGIFTNFLSYVVTECSFVLKSRILSSRITQKTIVH